MAASDFDQVVEQYHRSIGEFARGDPEPQKRIWSRRDDVCLANPLGPSVRGWQRVNEALDSAASQIRDGEGMVVENLVTVVTPEIAYIVEEELVNARLGGGESMAPIALRVTTIFRLEEGTWKIVHRHADPITSARSPESVVRT